MLGLTSGLRCSPSTPWRSRPRPTRACRSPRSQTSPSPAVKVAVCATDVPCGAAADKLFASNSLTVTPVTQRGRRQGGAVQGAARRGRRRHRLRHRRPGGEGSAVVGIDIPAAQNVTTDYPDRRDVRQRKRGDRAGVRRVRAVRRGQKVLADAGFEPAMTSRRGRVGDGAALARRSCPRGSRCCSSRCPWSACWCERRGAGSGRGAHVADALSALRLSLVTAAAATVVAVLLGVPLAWLLARATVPGRRFLRALVTVPLVLPPVVGGIALLLAFGRRGIVGSVPRRARAASRCRSRRRVSWSREAFVAMPFLVITVEGALRGLDRQLEDAAATLGASRRRDVPARHGAAHRAVARRRRQC